MRRGEKKIGLAGQEDRIRGGSARRDRRDVRGERGTRLAFGTPRCQDNPFINNGWRTVLRITNNRNIPLDLIKFAECFCLTRVLHPGVAISSSSWHPPSGGPIYGCSLSEVVSKPGHVANQRPAFSR